MTLEVERPQGSVAINFLGGYDVIHPSGEETEKHRMADYGGGNR
jgi:hypothetical protein